MNYPVRPPPISPPDFAKLSQNFRKRLPGQPWERTQATVARPGIRLASCPIPEAAWPSALRPRETSGSALQRMSAKGKHNTEEIRHADKPNVRNRRGPVHPGIFGGMGPDNAVRPGQVPHDG